jgi:hypothetical protein
MTIPETYPRGTTSLKNVAGAIFRYRWAFVWTVVTIGITVLVTALTPRQYESCTSILVQNLRASGIITPEASTAPAAAMPVQETEASTPLPLPAGLPSEYASRTASAPEATMPAFTERSEVRMQDVLHEKLTESWSERLSSTYSHRHISSGQHNRADGEFGGARGNGPSTVQGSGVRGNRPEIAYDQQGKVDYVTYTVNAREVLELESRYTPEFNQIITIQPQDV